MDKNRKKAIMISVIYGVFQINSSVFSKVILNRLLDVSTTPLPIWYLVCATLLICVVDIPFLLCIKYYATLGKVKVLKIIALFELLTFCIGVLVLVIVILLRLAQGTVLCAS